MLTGAFAREVGSEEDRRQLVWTLDSLASVLSVKTGGRLTHPVLPLRDGRARGPLIPVNLAVLNSLLGTPHCPDLTGCILVIEDVNEAAYRVDRYLNQLRQARVLGRLAGLVTAQFSQCDDAEYLPEVFADFAGCVNGPVASGLPFGHAFPSLSLPVGMQAALTVEGTEASLHLGA